VPFVCRRFQPAQDCCQAFVVVVVVVELGRGRAADPDRPCEHEWDRAERGNQAAAHGEESAAEDD